MEAFHEGRFKDAVRVFTQTTAAHPDYPAGHYMLGLALGKAQRPSEAIASLQRASDLDPKKASYSLALATTLVQVKRPEDALTALSKQDITKLVSDLRTKYVKAIAAAGSQADAATALPLLRKAAAQHDSSSDLWLALGKAASEVGEKPDAFRAYQQGFRLDPSQDSLGRRAMTVALQLGQENGASAKGQTWYRQGAELGEQLGLARLGENSRLLPGEAWLKADDAEAARAWFEKALKSRSKDPAAELGLARALLELEEPETALLALLRGLKDSPDEQLSSRIHRRLGFTYHQLEQYEKAAEAYRLGGAPDKAKEMLDYQAIADENLSIDRKRKE